MVVYIAFLRAVNVGGTGKLSMSELKSMCESLGFESVQTYIASGNVVIKSSESLSKVKGALASELEAYAGKPVGAMVRTSVNFDSVLNANPFTETEPSKAMILFLDRKATQFDIAVVSGLKNEELTISSKELYVHYLNGISASKIKLSASKSGTARNLNTVRKMILMAENL